VQLLRAVHYRLLSFRRIARRVSFAGSPEEGTKTHRERMQMAVINGTITYHRTLPSSSVLTTTIHYSSATLQFLPRSFSLPHLPLHRRQQGGREEKNRCCVEALETIVTAYLNPGDRKWKSTFSDLLPP
jgi:hypothetical protein